MADTIWPRPCRACPRVIQNADDALWHLSVAHSAVYTALVAGLTTASVVADPAIDCMTIGDLWECERQRLADIAF